jgi:hypothetical protein
MSVVTMVVLIVLITAISRTAKARYEALGRQHGGEIKSADGMRAEQEIRQLKERVQVLERVVIDNHSSVDLDREIERLRDR